MEEGEHYFLGEKLDDKARNRQSEDVRRVEGLDNVVAQTLSSDSPAHVSQVDLATQCDASSGERATRVLET
ncbi:hypothetical protein A2U01_0094885, partial [Trifolium medium]|nr:hypothetical protein [Trifolium medium]